MIVGLPSVIRGAGCSGKRSRGGILKSTVRIPWRKAISSYGRITETVASRIINGVLEERCG